SIHHQPHEMPSGNFLTMTANARRIDNYYTSETDPNAPRRPAMVVGDRIVEIRRADGAVVWSWNTFDHLDPMRLGYHGLDLYWHVRGFPNHADWTHGNGVTYDPRDDSIIMSLRNQDAVIKVDRASGRIKWILGEPSDWGPLSDKLLKPLGELRWPYHGHNPRVTRHGTIVMYDNGLMQVRPFREPISPQATFSRGVEYEVDEKAMTVRQVWASHRELSPDSCLSWAMGDAHRLPATDNMLVIDAACGERRPNLTPYYNLRDPLRHIVEFPMWARIRETTRGTGELVWEVRIADPNEILQWAVFGGVRVPSLYSDTVRDSRSR
ncbi:MAG: aryl-sulfate sulfotransferase, partial [Burkholderiales bacterium]